MSESFSSRRPVPDPFDEFGPIEAPPRRTPRWPFVLVGLFFAAGLTVLILWPVKVPYFAMSPGPVEEVSDLITVTDASTYEQTGELYLLTVGLREVNVFEYIEAQFDETVDLIDRDVIRPPGVTQEQVTRTNLESMDESIDTAVYVALSRLGYEVGFSGDGVVVLDVVEGSPAEEALQIDDLVDTIAGTPVATADEAAAVIRSFDVGDTVTLSGRRGDEPFTTSVTLVPHPDIEGAPMVGVLFDTVNLQMELPIDVQVDSRNIGGPSAGMMYTLAIIDLLTEDDLTKGHRIAGTGTIRFDETVGAIGGVRQKVFAARAIGAEYVLVPQDNYADALTAAEDDVEIVPIATLQDALDFLDSLEPAPALLAAG
jgi:PDZ domain-containing protein